MNPPITQDPPFCHGLDVGAEQLAISTDHSNSLDKLALLISQVVVGNHGTESFIIRAWVTCLLVVFLWSQLPVGVEETSQLQG